MPDHAMATFTALLSSCLKRASLRDDYWQIRPQDFRRLERAALAEGKSVSVRLQECGYVIIETAGSGALHIESLLIEKGKG